MIIKFNFTKLWNISLNMLILINLITFIFLFDFIVTCSSKSPITLDIGIGHRHIISGRTRQCILVLLLDMSCVVSRFKRTGFCLCLLHSVSDCERAVGGVCCRMV